MKILICGDRHWANKKVMKKVMDIWVKEGDTLIHGGAKGADNMSGLIGKDIGCNIKVFPANWKEYGRSAGPIRNREMLKENPDMIIGFHNDINKSKGTKDMLNIGKKNMIDTYIVTNKLMTRYK